MPKNQLVRLLLAIVLLLTMLQAPAQVESQTVQCVIPPSGLLSWWSGNGDATDLVGPNHGTAQGGVTYAAGKVGQALSFDGQTGFVQLPDNFISYPTAGTSNQPFSFDAWFKTTSSGVILGQQVTSPASTPAAYVPAVYVGTDGKLRVEMFWKGQVAPITSGASVNDGAFHHVAVTYDGTSERVYLDGSLIGSASHTQFSYSSSYRYQLGTGYTGSWPAGNGGWFFFNGIVDEVDLFNRALSASEIQAIVSAGSAGKCAPEKISVQLAPQMYQPVTRGQTFFTNQVQLEYHSGPVVLSGDPAPLNGMSVDDAMEITITRPDGTTRTWSHVFEVGCSRVGGLAPVDISSLFQPGLNTVSVRLYDICGVGGGTASAIFLTAIKPYRRADLSLTISASPNPATVADKLIYHTIVAKNNGPSTATGVGVSDILGEGPNFVSATSTQGPCVPALGILPANRTILCTVGSLASGAVVTITIAVEQKGPGIVSSTAGVTAVEPDDPNTTNNSATLVTTVEVPANTLSRISWPFNPEDTRAEKDWAFATIVNGYRGAVDHASGYPVFAFDFAKCIPERVNLSRRTCDLSGDAWLNSTGAKVLSPVTGQIAWVGCGQGGSTNALGIDIDGAPGYRVALSHVDGFPPVGTPVKQGQPIGTVSASACPGLGQGNHLHMALYQFDPSKADDGSTRVGIPFSGQWRIGTCNYADDKHTIQQWKGSLVPCR